MGIVRGRPDSERADNNGKLCVDFAGLVFGRLSLVLVALGTRYDSLPPQLPWNGLAGEGIVMILVGDADESKN